MKKQILVVTLLCLIASALSAAVDMQSREMKHLVKAVEKLREAKNGSKIGFTGAQNAAKTKLKAARLKNSGLEIDRLAAEIEEITTQYWGGVQADIDAQQQAGQSDHDFRQVMRSVVEWPKNLWIDCRTAEGRARAKAAREEFAARVDKASEERFKPYLAGNAGRGGNTFSTDIDRQLQVIATELPGMKKAVLEAQDTAGYSNYNKILAWQAYLTGILRLYPGNTKYQNALSAVHAELLAIGEESAFEARWHANGKVFASKVRMPAARSKDATVIEEVRNAFNNSGNSAEILKIHITTTQWTVIRNALTSVIEGRTQEAAIATRQPGGECLLYNVTIYQQHDGAAYTPARLYGFNNVEMACANAK